MGIQKLAIDLPGLVPLTVSDALLGNVLFGGLSVFITKNEMLLFCMLNVEKDGLSLDAITSCLWPDDRKSNKTFGVHLFNLRTKIFPMGLGIPYNQETKLYKLTIGDDA